MLLIKGQSTWASDELQEKNNQNYRIFGHNNDDSWLPLTYIVNGTFDVTQNQHWFDQNNFHDKSSLFIKRLQNPTRNIKRDGGMGRLVQDEFLSNRAIPNIFLHTLGGGYDVLWLEEYYRYHDYPYAFTLAVLTSYIARIGNEIYESTTPEITSHDHFADLFFFDVMGVVIASNDRASNFIVDDLGMKAWHFQPMWNATTDDFTNVGLNYVVRPKILHNSSNFVPFAYMGMQNMLGMSYYKKTDEIYSMAAGLFLTDPLQKNGRLVGALFYETNSMLASSLFINGSEELRWRLNIHPPLWKKYLKTSTNLGFLLAQTYSREFALGLNFNMPFGLGLTR